MSVDALSAVWRYSQAPDITSLLILIAVADWCDDDGYCYPSRRAVSLKTGASLATVKRAIRQHIARGELEKVQVKGHRVPSPREFVGRTGFQPTNLYRLCLIDKLGSKRPLLLARNRGRSGVRQTPVTGTTANGKWGQGDPESGVRGDPKVGSGVISSLLSDTSEIRQRTRQKELSAGVRPAEPVENPAPGRAGAPRRDGADEDPEKNLGVLTKLAHEVLDLLANTPDVEVREVELAVERRCQLFDVASSRDVIQRAIESALYQRRRAGKPSVIRGSPGESAFRMQGGSGSG